MDDLISTEYLDLSSEISQIADMYPEKKSIYIDYMELVKNSPPGFDPSYFIEYPIHAIEFMKSRLTNELGTLGEDMDLHVRLTNIPDVYKAKVRELRVNQLYRMISIDGLVTQITKVVPKMTSACWRCQRCKTETHQPVHENTLKEPVECSCGKSNNKTVFKLIEDKCEYIDYQLVEVQDPPESLRGHEQPERLECWIEDDLCGKLLLSDFVELTGVMLNKRKKNKRTGEWVLEVNSIDIKNTEFEEMNLTDEDVDEIEKLVAESDIYPKVINSIAPSIKGYGMVKQGLALQLFSGVSKTMLDGQRIRGNIHVLMVGDPGTAKSQMIRRMAYISPRGMTGSGKGTSGAGLTAAAIQMEVLGESKWVAEAGTLVLADRGLAAIDELDKMSANDRSALHEAMEQQTISIDKANIHTKFNARTSVLCASNPVEGRFEPHKKLSNQIDLPPPLLSRFDLIFTIQDIVNEEKDREITKHILTMHREGQKILNDENYVADEQFKAPIERELLRKYVSYAKTKVPVLTDEASDCIDDFYIEMRKKGVEADHPVPITARQLESIIRLSEASARLHLRDEVTEEDAKIAINIIQYYLKKVVGDDIDLVMTEYSFDDRTITKKITELIADLQTGYENGIPIGELTEAIVEEDMPLDTTLDIMNKLRRRGVLFTPQHEHWKVS